MHRRRPRTAKLGSKKLAVLAGNHEQKLLLRVSGAQLFRTFTEEHVHDGTMPYMLYICLPLYAFLCLYHFVFAVSVTVPDPNFSGVSRLGPTGFVFWPRTSSQHWCM